MSFLTKSYLIELGIMITGFIIGFLLRYICLQFGDTELAEFCLTIPVILLGIYILFGKYVCLMGSPPGIVERLIIGFGFILMPFFFFFIT